MKRLASIFFFFTLSASLAATANENIDIEGVLKRVEQTGDPMPTNGAFAGERVENIKGRTLQFLTSKEKELFSLDRTALAFANYRDHGHFYIASLPNIRVDEQNHPLSADAIVGEVHIIRDHWEQLTNSDLSDVEVHTYLRFLFNDPSGIRLIYDQTEKARVPAAAATIFSAVLSIEALRPMSQPDANFLPYSLAFDFALGPLFYSSYDRTLSEEPDTGRVLQDDELNLNSSTSLEPMIARPHEALLFQALRASNDWGRSTTYNIVLNNCTNRLFDIIDAAIANKSGFNKSLFVKDVKRATDANIAKGINALFKIAAEKNMSIPQNVRAELNKATMDSLSEQLVEGAQTSSIPQKYFTWLPIFVTSHLLARDLLDKK